MVNRYDADGCQSAIGNYVSYDDYAELQKTLAAARSYVVLDARRGDAHAIGLLNAIDKALK